MRIAARFPGGRAIPAARASTVTLFRFRPCFERPAGDRPSGCQRIADRRAGRDHAHAEGVSRAVYLNAQLAQVLGHDPEPHASRALLLHQVHLLDKLSGQVGQRDSGRVAVSVLTCGDIHGSGAAWGPGAGPLRRAPSRRFLGAYPARFPPPGIVGRHPSGPFRGHAFGQQGVERFGRGGGASSGAGSASISIRREAGPGDFSADVARCGPEVRGY